VPPTGRSPNGCRYPSIDEFNGYTVLAHGTGICDEYPSLYIREKWDATGFDGVIESGNIFSIESFVGRRNGKEGVKLEQQILVTDPCPRIAHRFAIVGSLNHH